jgi:multidrug efflux system outer membrane protein
MKTPRHTLLLAGPFLLLGLAACSVGPDYERPKLDVPPGFKSATEPAAPESRLATDWWTLFNDPRLNDLEKSAADANQGLRAAVARVAQARATLRVTQSQFYPVVALDPSAVRERTSGTLGDRGFSRTGTTRNDFKIPFDVSYEVDIWGRVRRASDVSLAQLAATKIDYQVVLQTLQADLARNYFSLRSLDLQSQILDKTVGSFRRQVSLTQTQLKAGLVGKTDLAQAQVLLNTAIAQRVDVGRQRADAEHAIAILAGRPPSELSLDANPLQTLPPAVPVGLPADLLKRRPDVAEAEQNLVAANAQVGVAIANFYPVVRLTGAAGFESIDIGRVFDWESRIWSIGPSVTVPLFEGGRLDAELAQAKARYDEVRANYRAQVLAAFRDVEDSLSDLHMRADQAQAQDQAVNDASEYVRLSTLQYEQGLTNYLLVIDAERTLLSAELTAAQVLEQRLISTVLLIKALGGGWDPEASDPQPLQNSAER